MKAPAALDATAGHSGFIAKLCSYPAGRYLPLSRGGALHFAPGIVDTIFLYFALLAILTGNRNVVRISSRPSPQIDLLMEVLNQLFADPAHDAVANQLLIVRYGHDDLITAALSAVCDLRVIWGGDQTVQTIRALPLRPRARDVNFPNRRSLATLSAVLGRADRHAQPDCTASRYAQSDDY